MVILTSIRSLTWEWTTVKNIPPISPFALSFLFLSPHILEEVGPGERAQAKAVGTMLRQKLQT